MNEVQWVEQVADQLDTGWLADAGLSAKTGLKLAYGCEIASYGSEIVPRTISFATDLAIIEDLGDGRWKPRDVVEAKLGSVTTHDAITYSQKAATHRAVHPYLRYGIMLGHRRHHPLPGRLYRHGAQFDFMLSFRELQPSLEERALFHDVLKTEVAASKALEQIMYETRKRTRPPYTVLHRQLKLS